MNRIVLLFLAGAVAAPAHDVITTKLTWSVEISRIVQRRCLSCHREGGSAPMSLVKYDAARPWAKAIRDEVLGRRMPPWGAVKGYGDVRDDPSLTQDEVMRIAEWVEGGAPEGDPKYLPSAPPVTEVSKPVKGRRVRVADSLTIAVLLGLRPLEDVESAKVYAQFPDGSMEPLLWLRGYQRKWNRTFVLREPLTLPRGTNIVSDPKTAIELVIKSPRPAR